MKTISKKLLFGVIVASSLITAIITCISMYQKYLSKLDMLDMQFSVVYKTNAKSLVNNIWQLDDEQLQFQLEGIEAFPDVDKVTVVYDGDERKVVHSIGKVDAHHISFKRDLFFNERKLGEVVFYSNYSHIYKFLWGEMAITLLIQSLKTFLASFLILFVFNFLLTRHLKSIDSQLKGSDNQGAVKLLKNFKPFDQPDEINHLCASINDMIEKLNKQNKFLEVQIKNRTKELEIETKRAIDASNAKSLFLANMSHEVRTPLNGIIGSTDILLEDTKLKRGVAENLQVIKDSAENLLVIVNDVLTFNSLGKNKIVLAHKPFSIKELCENALQILSSKAQSKDLSLSLDFKSLQESLVGDKTRIAQIIYNIVGNAIKFTEKGEIHVEVDWKEASNSKGILTITVRDTGIGIKKEDLEQLFKEFSQVGNSVENRAEGTGLGLVISQNLAKMMGGDIMVESEFGKGSTFSILLRLEKTVILTKETTPKKADFSGLSILVVEDNMVNQKVVRKLLEKLNVQVTVANNGKHGFEIAKNQQFDAILMDMHMPIMNGLEATKAIRKLDHCKKIPIAALTASVLEDQKQICFISGMSHFLSKPIRKKILIEFLNEISNPDRLAS